MRWFEKLRRVRSEIHQTFLASRELAARGGAEIDTTQARLDRIERAIEALRERGETRRASREALDERMSVGLDAIVERLERLEAALPSISGAATVGSFVPPGHFYSPIVDPTEIASRRASIFDRSREPAGIDLRETAQLDWLARLAPHAARLPFGREPTDGLRYGTDNVFFGVGDATVLASTLMELRPARVVEVGSGHSSCVMMDVNERFLDRRAQIAFVEPNPERLLGLIRPEDGDSYPVHRTGVQDCDPAVFADLAAGDILFIDSTHVAKTGSDVVFELFELLPRLTSGVYVHFHDVFYPFEYPESWVIEENRSWNELYVLRAFLTDNPSWEIVFFNDFIGRRHGAAAAAALPGFATNPGGSLWLRKR